MSEESNSSSVFDNITRNKKEYSVLMPRNLSLIDGVSEWVVQQKLENIPDPNSTNKNESKLGKIWAFIKEYFLIPYNSLENENDKKRFLEIIEESCGVLNPEEVKQKIKTVFFLEKAENAIKVKLRIVQEIELLPVEDRLQLNGTLELSDDDSNSLILWKAKQISDWIRNHNTNTLVLAPQDNDPKNLSISHFYREIKDGIIEKYLSCENEDDRKKFFVFLKKRYHLSEKQFMDIMKLIDSFTVTKNIDEPVYYRNALLIENWIQQHGKAPRGSKECPDSEKALYRKLDNIRHGLILPLVNCKTKEQVIDLLKRKKQCKYNLSLEQYKEIVRIYKLAEDSVDSPKKISATHLGQATFGAKVARCDEAARAISMLEMINEEQK